MRDRVFRAVPAMMLALAVMALVAYAFGRLTDSDWVWWLAPLTVALEGTRFIRDDLVNAAAIPNASAESIDVELEDSTYATSCAIATGMAFWGACTGNRLSIVTAATVAVVWNAVDWDEPPVVESPKCTALTNG